MSSTRSHVLARRSAGRPLTVSLVVLTLAAGCGNEGDKPAAGPDADREMHEVAGAVQTWPGEAEAPCGSRLTVERFTDDVGARAATETRALITSARAYRDYFGHAPPAGVNLGREWVVFYAAGKQASGAHRPDVSVVGARGDMLHVVTTLTGPIPPCAPPTPGYGGASGGGSSGAGGSTGSRSAGSGGSSSSGNSSSGAAGTAPAGSAGSPGVGTPLIMAPPSIPPQSPVPPPPSPRDYLPYVLVKFPAQATRSVDFQHQDLVPRCGGRPPEGNPCDAVRCAAGQTCVVLESYPPQARCVPAPTPSDRCTSSATCPRGTRCSTERGDCQGCGAGPEVACPAVCFGVCEPAPSDMCTGGALMGGCRSEEALKTEAAETCKRAGQVLRDFAAGETCPTGGFVIAKYTCCGSALPPPPPPAVCKADSDCRLSSSECGQSPCTCAAKPVAGDLPGCAMPAIACLVDPCANLQAACVAGQCVMQRPQPPTCTWSYLGGSGACRSYDAWKQTAHDACQKGGGSLTNLSTGTSCAGGFTEVKYECCPLMR